MSNANHFKENYSQFVSRLKDNYESIAWRLQDTRDVEWNKRGRGGLNFVNYFVLSWEILWMTSFDEIFPKSKTRIL